MRYTLARRHLSARRVAVVVAAESATFGSELYTRMRRLAHEFILLGDLCLGEEPFNLFMQQQIVSFLSTCRFSPNIHSPPQSAVRIPSVIIVV